MKLAVFGASGKTGMQVVQQALDGGHSVKAFVRDPKKMILSHDNLEVVQGDVLDPQAAARGVEGVEGVIVALGAGPDTKGPMMTQGTQNIIDGMKKHGVGRLIVESSYPMSGSNESMEFLRKLMKEDQIASAKPLIDDKAGQERVTRESGVEWTLVRPLMLTDGPKTGNYRVSSKLDVKPGDSISRADVAEFMLKVLADSDLVGKIVVIAS